MTNKPGLKAVMFGLTLGIPLYAADAQNAGNGIVDNPLATIQGETPGVHIDILSIKRSEGGMVTLRAAFVNESGAPVKGSAFPGMDGSGWRVSLLDYQAKKKYGVVMFDDGSCLCTTNLIYNRDFEPGRKILWAKFRAPPESVAKVTVLGSNGEPVEGIPITR
jgi:hypothetical protein